MIEHAERWAIPWLSFLVEWSVRWGIVIGVLAVWLAVRPPRKTARAPFAVPGGTDRRILSALCSSLGRWIRDHFAGEHGGGGGGRASVDQGRQFGCAGSRPRQRAESGIQRIGRGTLCLMQDRRARPRVTGACERGTHRWIGGGWRRLC